MMESQLVCMQLMHGYLGNIADSCLVRVEIEYSGCLTLLCHDMMPACRCWDLVSL